MTSVTQRRELATTRRVVQTYTQRHSSYPRSIFPSDCGSRSTYLQSLLLPDPLTFRYFIGRFYRLSTVSRTLITCRVFLFSIDHLQLLHNFTYFRSYLKLWFTREAMTCILQVIHLNFIAIKIRTLIIKL